MQSLEPDDTLERRLRETIHSLGPLPLPGRGQTLQRWDALARAASHSMPVGKCVESHADALAIVAELGARDSSGTGRRQSHRADESRVHSGNGEPDGTIGIDSAGRTAGSVWAVWAAEVPGVPLQADFDAASRAPAALADGSDQCVRGTPVLISGSKPWCSGAGIVTHGLVTTRDRSGQAWLVAVDMKQPGIDCDHGKWVAVGMRDTATATVTFDAVPGVAIGSSGGYLERPGFWQGAIGVAACWYGGAVALADVLRRSVTRRHDAHALAHLGNVDASLCAARAALREAAQWIDANPRADARRLALRVRWQVEATVRDVLRDAGECMGATPFCIDPQFARMAADLPVFVRQSHARRDAESLGRLTMESGEGPHWWLAPGS